MLDELKGYIGFRSDGNIEAPSGLYVDALPDISTSIIDRIITNEDSQTDAWERIEKRALLKFRTLFIREVNKCHKISDIDKCECLIVSNKDVLATALWYLLGAEVMLTRKESSRINAATINRDKNNELRAYFEEQFAKELEVAVNSIDVHRSPCFPAEDQPEPNAVVTIVTPIL